MEAARNRARKDDPETILGVANRTLRMFFYLDDTEVSGLYSQLGDAENVPLSRDLEQQASGDVSAGIRGSWASVGGKRSRSSKEHMSFERESDPYRMYVAVERRLLADHDVTTVDLLTGFDMEPLAAIDRLVEALEAMGFMAPPDAVAAIRASRKDFEERRVTDRISQLTGYVAIRADYLVRSAQSALMLEVSLAAASVAVCCDDKWLRGSGRNAIIPGAQIRATCIGKVVRWDALEQQLVVLPIAVV